VSADALQELRASVRNYYSAKVARHGPTPLGVDWPNAISQQLRFVQLLKLCDFSAPFSLSDFGCGYGALLEFLDVRHRGAPIAYHGIDISSSMVDTARGCWSKNPHATFVVGARCTRETDYALASGVFNVRLGHPVAVWESYVAEILADLNGSSRIGFAVNFMLPHDERPTEDELYRTAPERWIEFCRQQLGRNVETVRDYGLREFTLLVRRR
jgi:SAM-dependent methyltransferase